MSVAAFDQELIDRRRQGLMHSFGPIVMAALKDPDVIEIMLNDDGKLWVESLGEMAHVGEMTPDDALAVLSQVSSALDGEMSKEDPFVEGELVLLNGERFEGVAPPVSERAMFAIRKKALRIFTLADYCRHNVLSFAQAETLRQAIRRRLNILVVGGTGSGKTTFCNAMLAELALLMPEVRMLLLEDTRELQCALQNKSFLRTSPWTTMARISKAVKRLRPDAITVGEVRDGAPALEMLKLWTSGHPGGLATVHADSAHDGLTKLDQLVQEVSNFPQRVLIGQAVNLVVFLERQGGKRKVKEIVSVQGYDEISKRFQIVDVQ